jgi:hypothetical protein
MGYIFSILGLRRVPHYILSEMSKIIPYLSSVLEPELGFSLGSVCINTSKGCFKVKVKILSDSTAENTSATVVLT